MNGFSEDDLDALIVGSCLTSVCCAYLLESAGLKVARLKLQNSAPNFPACHVSSWSGLQPSGTLLDLSRLGLNVYRDFSGIVGKLALRRTPNLVVAMTARNALILRDLAQQRIEDGGAPIFNKSHLLRSHHPTLPAEATAACWFGDEVRIDPHGFELSVERELERKAVFTATADDLNVSVGGSNIYEVITREGVAGAKKLVVCNLGDHDFCKSSDPFSIDRYASYLGMPGTTSLTALQAVAAHRKLQSIAREIRRAFEARSNRSVFTSGIKSLFRSHGRLSSTDQLKLRAPYCGFYPRIKGIVVAGGAVDVSHITGLARLAADLIEENWATKVRFPPLRKGHPGAAFRVRQEAGAAQIPWIG